MSELKAIRSGEIYNIIEYEDCYRTDDLYYPKSEADAVLAEKDKVIAEKDSEIARLNAIRKVHVEAIESMGAGLLQYDKEIRHQKYKRCLANAEACMHKRWRPDEGFDYARSTRHMNKWLEIAEQFKPDGKTDIEAEEMHEKIVDYVMEHFDEVYKG